MKHKTYSCNRGQTTPVLVSKLEAYLTKQCELEIKKSAIEDGEHVIMAITQNDVGKRIIGQNKTIVIGIRSDNNSMEVRAGLGACFNRFWLILIGLFFLPFLPIAILLVVIGNKSQSKIFDDIWVIIDNYMN